MFRIILGAVMLFVLQLVFFDQSVKVMAFSHNVFSEAKVVYHATKKVIEKKETVEEFSELVEDVSNTGKEVKDGS